VNLNLVERPNALWVSMKGHPLVEGDQQYMVVGKWEEGNKMALYRVADIEVHHKEVVVGCKGCDVSWNQSTHLQHGTSQVCPDQMVRVWVH
jgi:hypothetical protein